MGSIQDPSHNGYYPKDVWLNGSSHDGTDQDNSLAFKVFGLASDEATAPTGMKDDIILLSWLFVLSRTQDREQVSFEWAYRSPVNGVSPEIPPEQVSWSQIATELPINVGQIATAISHSLPKVTATHGADVSGPVSLLLSTGPLSQTSGEATDEVSRTFTLETYL